MTGWKTKFGGIGMICTGIGFVIAGIVADPIDGNKIGEGLTLTMAGFAAIGIGHKIEKTTNSK